MWTGTYNLQMEALGVGWGSGTECNGVTIRALIKGRGSGSGTE